MKIALIEDDEKDQSLLLNLLNQVMENYNLQTIIDCYKSGEEFFNQTQIECYDLYFIDIYMDGINGFEVAKKIRSMSTETELVFLTNSTEYIEESYDVEAFRYILKPIDKRRLDKVIQKYIEKWEKQNRGLKVMIERQEYTFPYSKIEAIVTVGRNIEIYTDKTRFKTNRRQSFEELTKSLSKDNRFILLGQGIIVNLNYICRIEGNNALLKSGKKLPISRRKISAVTEAFVRFQLGI